VGIEAECVTIISRHDEWQVGKLKKPGVRNPGPRPADSWQRRIVTLHPTLMPQVAAARRLDGIVDLAHEAIADPRPAFGKVLTTKAAGREKEFESAIGAEFYWRSSECALFGVSPSFTEVFTQHPERTAFVDAFQHLLTPVYDTSLKQYVLS
jgi:hypothetical protein